MDVPMVALRIVHIVTGVMWAGGAALFFFYVEPTVNKLGPDAEKFIHEVVNVRKLPIYFIVANTLTVLTGAILYWRDFGGIDTSPFGLALGIGGLSALVAWLGGNLLIPRGIATVGSIAGEMKAAGGPPSPELMGRMRAAQERLRLVGLVDLILLGIAVALMASARYLG